MFCRVVIFAHVAFVFAICIVGVYRNRLNTDLLVVDGLIQKFPSGYAYNEPTAVDNWGERRECRANRAQATCCVEVHNLQPDGELTGNCEVERQINNIDDRMLICVDCETADVPLTPEWRTGLHEEELTFLDSEGCEATPSGY